MSQIRQSIQQFNINLRCSEIQQIGYDETHEDQFQHRVFCDDLPPRTFQFGQLLSQPAQITSLLRQSMNFNARSSDEVSAEAMPVINRAQVMNALMKRAMSQSANLL